MIGPKTAKSHRKSMIALTGMQNSQVDDLLLKKRPIGLHPLVLAAD